MELRAWVFRLIWSLIPPSSTESGWLMIPASSWPQNCCLFSVKGDSSFPIHLQNTKNLITPLSPICGSTYHTSKWVIITTILLLLVLIIIIIVIMVLGDSKVIYSSRETFQVIVRFSYPPQVGELEGQGERRCVGRTISKDSKSSIIHLSGWKVYLKHNVSLWWSIPLLIRISTFTRWCYGD